MAAGLLVVVLLVAVGILAALTMRFGPVKRDRLARFAERGALPITLENGNLVIRYLGLTRRWRALGLLTGCCVSIAWSLREGTVNLNLLLGFGGWFVGAVIAEYEFRVIDPGHQRAASLRPRLLRDRLSVPARIGPLVIVAIALGCAAILLVTRILDAGIAAREVLGYLALTGVLIGIPALVGRHVLSRAQPSGLPPDVRDADDALRHRSLHVLAGSAIALTAYPASALATMVSEHFARTDPALSQPPITTGFFVLAGVLLVLLPVVGWLVARTRRVPEPAEMSRAV